MRGALPGPQLEAVADVVRSRLGLHYPPERLHDLLRGLREAAEESAGDPGAIAASLTSGAWSESMAASLAAHLTVGETYFFRERATLDVLARTILPELLRARRADGLELRLWSAGCCTGEEPYTLAMLLRDVLSAEEPLAVRLLGTDVNLRFLEAARRGEYGSWSLRETGDAERERFFTRVGPKRWRISDDARSGVTFRLLNLATGEYPSVEGGTAEVDVILCRNVLMYFDPVTAARAVERFHRALRPGGWLAVSPVEVPLGIFERFTPVVLGGATLFRKLGPPLPPAPADEPLRTAASIPARAPEVAPPPTRPVDAGEPARKPSAPSESAEASLSTRVRELAGAGRLAEALELADRLVEEDPMHASSHHLRAAVLSEAGDDAGAWDALSRAVYLDPAFVVAHVAIGTLARRTGRTAAARRAFRNALALLDGLPPAEPVPGGDGMTAEQLARAVRDSGGGEVP